MKYEENIWYGWNGGECPVHPNTRVRAVYIESMYESVDEDTTHARYFKWNSDSEPIIAFKVEQEFKEPREFWAYELNGKIVACPDSSTPGSFLARQVKNV